MGNKIVKVLYYVILFIVMLCFMSDANQNIVGYPGKKTEFDISKITPDNIEVESSSDELPKNIDSKLTTLAFILDDEQLNHDILSKIFLLAENYDKSKSYAVQKTVKDNILKEIDFLTYIGEDIDIHINPQSINILFSDGPYGYRYSYSSEGSLIKTVASNENNNIYIITNTNNKSLKKINISARTRIEKLTDAQINAFDADLKSGIISRRSVYTIEFVKEYLYQRNIRVVIYYIVFPLSLLTIIGAIIIYTKKSL